MIYIHVPFCDGKCPYCDFYSLVSDDKLKDSYVQSLIAHFKSRESKKINAKSIYFGGGTPNLLGAERLTQVLKAAKSSFSPTENAEITVEVNPGQIDAAFFKQIKAAGFNRISMGLQSANENELKLLGRQHTAEDVRNAVADAKSAGFENISVDLMIGLPNSTVKTLKMSIDFAASLEVQHISSYILKIEENTTFSKADKVILPGDDEVSEQYLFAVEELAKYEFAQYEISNFSKKGFESRHNLVYWQGDNYLGFGPAAHSFYEGERFYYPRNIDEFIAGSEPISDGAGGDFDELVMLSLRLSEGLSRESCEQKFGDGSELYKKLLKNAQKCPQELILADNDRIKLTPKGFLLSNQIILKLLDF